MIVDIEEITGDRPPLQFTITVVFDWKGALDRRFGGKGADVNETFEAVQLAQNNTLKQQVLSQF